MIPVPRPSGQRGDLRSISGSDNDDFSNVLLNQVAYALWLEPCDADEQNRLVQATLAAMIGMKPRDEIEGMLIAQLIASYSAAMECYRRAMLGEQTLEARRENLSSRPKEFHLRALLEPCMTLSSHTAPDVRPLP